TLRLLHRFGLLLGELAQPAQEILGIASERETSETAFHATTLAEVDQVAAENILGERFDNPGRSAKHIRDSRANLVEIGRRGQPWLVLGAGELGSELAHRDNRRSCSNVLQ